MLYLILSALFFAVNNILWKWIVAGYFPLQVIVKRSIITSFIGVFVLMFNYNNYTFYNTIGQAVFINLTCFVGALGLVFMIYALKKCSISTFIHYSLFGALFSATYLYYIEHIIPNNYVIGLIVISLGFFVFLRNQRNSSKKVDFSTHRNLFLMSICFSTTAIMQWYNLQTHDFFFLVVHQEIMVLVVSAVLLYYLKQPAISVLKLDFIYLMALVVFLAVITGMYGLKTTDPFISNIISLSSSIFTMILAVFLLKDRFKWEYIISLIMVISGAWLLS